MAEDRSVKFEPDGIGHLLKDLVFRVPAHQRSYKWERQEHVKQLFEDISEAMAEPKSDGYFLGMIVLKLGQTRKDRLEVIDGQQRLATVSIFMAAVRDYFKAQGDNERANEIQRTYLAERDTRSLTDEARLHLNTEDKRFFETCVIKGRHPTFKKREAVPLSHRRIVDATLEAKDWVNKIVSLGSARAAGDRLLDWVEYFLFKARVVAIYVPEEQNAYTLFETLNDRGLELSKADLIKNHLFGRAGGRLEDVKQLWTEMTVTLEGAGGEEGTVDYIRHFWISNHGHVRTKQLYQKLRQKTHGAGAAYETAVSLRDDATLYASLVNPEAELWKNYKDTASEHAKTLLSVGVSIIKPLALSVLRNFEPNEVATAFRLFVNWSVRFLIVGGHRSEAVEKPFANVAHDVTQRKIRTGPQMAKSLANVIPQDEDFKNAFARATVSKPALARYYLRAIEDYKADAPHPEWIAQPSAEKVNLEHVLPLNPDAGWKISREDSDVLHNRIGNLALLSKVVNRDIGNKTFAKKKVAFKESSFEFSHWIYEQAAWTAKEIDKRQSLLANEAIKTWPLRFW